MPLLSLRGALSVLVDELDMNVGISALDVISAKYRPESSKLVQIEQ